MAANEYLYLRTVKVYTENRHCKMKDTCNKITEMISSRQNKHKKRALALLPRMEYDTIGSYNKLTYFYTISELSKSIMKYQ